MLRLFGVSESAVARALADAGGDGDGVEVTICARDFEIHVDLVVAAGRGGARGRARGARSRAPLEQYLFGRGRARRSRSIVLDLCRARGLTLATAESCTGGLVAARLTSVPGLERRLPRRHRRVRERGEGARSSAFRRSMLAEHGAVSAEIGRGDGRGRARSGSARTSRSRSPASPARAAARRRSRSGSSTCTRTGPDGELGRELDFPGDRDAIRARSTVVALHLVRRF